MEDAGYGFGPLFRKQIAVEAVAGNSHSRSTLDLAEPASLYAQSSYPMHPVNIDACLQSGAPSLWLGHRSAVNAVLVPAIIDDLVIYPSQIRATTGIATCSREFIGVGRSEEAKSYKSDIHVYDPGDGSPLLSVSGLHYYRLDTRARSQTSHDYTCVVWRPDVTWISEDMLSLLDSEPRNQLYDNRVPPTFHQVLDIIAHKRPTLKVVEANIGVTSSESVWFSHMHRERGARTAYRQFVYALQSADSLLDARARYVDRVFTEFVLLELTKNPEDFVPVDTGFDLVIIKEVRRKSTLTISIGT